ncbi:MAG: reductive dehalogenase domain-containing protein, partial [Pseudomonadota bacterium]
MPRKTEIWEPPAAAQAAMSEVNGNAYNGVGERRARPPKPFFWHPADLHHWGDMQAYTGRIMFGSEDSEEVMEAFCVDGKPGSYLPRGPAAIEKAPRAPDRDAAGWTEAVKAFALDNHADDVGVAALNPNWVFEGYELDLPWVISVAVQHDYDELKHAPSFPGDNRCIIEVGRQYTRAAVAANTLRNFILSNGYEAVSFEGPRGGALAMIPAAIAGGLGELGKHHSMIHPRFGSAFRLSAVATDMPLTPGAVADFGADEFCMSCQVCTDECPPAAIVDEKQWVRDARTAPRAHGDADAAAAGFCEVGHALFKIDVPFVGAA